MRRFLAAAVAFLPLAAHAQAPRVSAAMPPAAQLLATTRALYDAPFTRGLVTFDCAVQFDWAQHYIEVLGAVPPAAQPAIALLRAIPHRVLVDRNGATVSPQRPLDNLAGTPPAEELEKALASLVANGLNAWLPFATNVILPAGATPYTFEKVAGSYKLSLNGNGVQAQLLLAPDLRLTSGVTQQPQPLRFDTTFTPGPQGFLLASVRTGDTTDTALDQRALFTYAYQPIQGFSLPTEITVTPARTEIWRYELTDCKVVQGTVIELTAPAEAPVQP